MDSNLFGAKQLIEPKLTRQFVPKEQIPIIFEWA